ncbi:hypothetical protein HKX48_008857 [Thoreauomyces humboldtii]|nr:hypothetical protein HKX48_008857 [Thoreauomyces humboldtii]
MSGGDGAADHHLDDADDFREQDRFLPTANVARLMKKSLPENSKIAKEAKDCIMECVSEFISFVTSEASDRCVEEKRKTINGEDILWALQSLGFDAYCEVMKIYLSRYRELTKMERAAAIPPPKPASTGPTPAAPSMGSSSASADLSQQQPQQQQQQVDGHAATQAYLYAMHMQQQNLQLQQTQQLQEQPQQPGHPESLAQSGLPMDATTVQHQQQQPMTLPSLDMLQAGRAGSGPPSGLISPAPVAQLGQLTSQQMQAAIAAHMAAQAQAQGLSGTPPLIQQPPPRSDGASTPSNQ